MIGIYHAVPSSFCMAHHKGGSAIINMQVAARSLRDIGSSSASEVNEGKGSGR